MSYPKSIGGYFELELQKGFSFHRDLIAVNSGRNAFEYILMARKYKHVYLPYYTCDVMLEPLKKHSISFDFYSINTQLEPAETISIKPSSAFLYTNYFGVKSSYILALAAQMEHLIIDSSQAFFSEPIQGIDTFYSPRKFFGLPDGGFVSSNLKSDIEMETDISAERVSHLLLRIDKGPEAGYNEFKINDKSLSNQSPKRMSPLTTRILAGIDYEKCKATRKKNFQFLHSALKETNLMKWLDDTALETPMVYPFLCDDSSLREKLINNRIYVANYWPNVKEWAPKDSYEQTLCEFLLPLPIDQRCELLDMEKIIKIING